MRISSSQLYEFHGRLTVRLVYCILSCFTFQLTKFRYLGYDFCSNHMAVKMLPQVVANAFVKQYYAILNKCPENVHKFYQESSLLGWPGSDGVLKPVTTLSGINDKIMSSDYKYCSAEIKTTDAQESVEGGVIVAVTGSLTRKDNVKMDFSQTFFLAKQEKGFFVLNDILRVSDVFLSTANAPADYDGINDQHAPSMQSSAARGIYIGRLPYDITKQGIVDVLKQFGPVRRNADTIQIRRHEVHHVKFGDKEAYITYKRSYSNRGNNGGGRSPTRAGSRNSNFRGRENQARDNSRFQNENRADHNKGQTRGRRHNRWPSDQWSREASRDR
ncbi:UNVERIFIED_CONTAM: Nuclear transport factor 2 [Sesamum indicum]